MHRRCFLRTTAAWATVAAGPRLPAEPTETHAPQVLTVTGPLAADQLGPMLPHEHVLVDFVGADKADPGRYDADQVFQVMLPYLQRAGELGCQAMAECTPAWLGRDPALLRRLAQASGVRLLTNTGLYGARRGKFLPPYAFRDTADDLARRWVREFHEGIGPSGIRPGFIKIGVDGGPLTQVNRKLVQAAARCHLQTGLTIASHTGDGVAAAEQVDILRRQGVHPSAWIWVHAQNVEDPEAHLRIARAGAWVELDGIGPNSIQRHVSMVMRLRRADLLDRVLLSHDAGWYSVGEPGGGQVRGYDTLWTMFRPALRQAGLADEIIRQLTVTNPARAFSIAVRGAPRPN